MNDVNGRPEWAQGPEWDGWRKYKNDRICRNLRCDVSRLIVVEKRASDYVLSGWVFSIPFISVGRLGQVADLIAQDRGGWA